MKISRAHRRQRPHFHAAPSCKGLVATNQTTERLLQRHRRVTDDSFWDTTFVGASGVLFTVAAQNTIKALHPNLSISHYRNRTGKAFLR